MSGGSKRGRFSPKRRERDGNNPHKIKPNPGIFNEWLIKLRRRILDLKTETHPEPRRV